MKALVLIILSSFFSAVIFAQTITWSPDLVKPKETETNSLLTFPGTDENYYYADESVFGTETIRRKWKDFIKTVDKTTLRVSKETDLSGEIAEDGKKYFNVKNFVLNNSSYNFFIDMNDKETYTVYATVKKVDDPKTPTVKPIQKVDIKNEKPFKNAASVIKHKDSKETAALKAASHVEIQPAYDGKSIISAFVYESLDEDYSMLNISEWDADLKVTASINYKIPFKAEIFIDKTVFGKAPNGSGINASISDFAKDNNGFVYVSVRSANPDDKEEGMASTLYQFKLSDPAYVKIYKKEIGKNIQNKFIQMYQNSSGKIFIAATGKEGDGETYYTNSAYFGSFSEQGQLQTIFSKQLSAVMMYNFDKEKDVDKNGGVIGLYLINILPSTEGGCFVLWEQQLGTTREYIENGATDNQSKSQTYYGSYTILVQYFNSANKMLWQKPVYKKQSRTALLPDIYTKVASFVLNDAVYLFYPDDPKNANKAVDDKEVSVYNVTKFASKDLAGMFVAKFDTKGTYTRKYINWPEDRIGFALCTNSFKYTGNGECIGAARKIRQAGLFVKSEEYTFFKLKF
ncbi:MAG: hypothetical protein ABIR78_06140 [Ferruginibacter sp.]